MIEEYVFKDVCYAWCCDAVSYLHLWASILDRSNGTAFFSAVMLSGRGDAFTLVVDFRMASILDCSLSRMVGRSTIHFYNNQIITETKQVIQERFNNPEGQLLAAG